MPQPDSLYSLRVIILAVPMPASFVATNTVISRTVEIRGSQTLQALHGIIEAAFDREDDTHLYEFQIGGARAFDRKARRYILPAGCDAYEPGDPRILGVVDRTTVESLALGVGDRVGYVYDFGDCWWHRVECIAIGSLCPAGGIPGSWSAWVRVRRSTLRNKIPHYTSSHIPA